MKNRILFVMPVLHTVQYTKAAYDSLKANSDPRHEIVVGMDWEDENDKKFYEDNNIPYTVYHGWGHWTMACYEVFKRGHEFDFVGLIHNDMIFGYRWLEGFEKYIEEIGAKDNELYSFVHLSNASNPRWLEQFDWEDFNERSKKLKESLLKSVWWEEMSKNFLPWIMTIEGFKTTFGWLHGGDTEILHGSFYKSVGFLDGGVFHFGNIACTLHPGEFRTNQTTRANFSRFIQDERFREIISFLALNAWSKNSVARELYELSKAYVSR